MTTPASPDGQQANANPNPNGSPPPAGQQPPAGQPSDGQGDGAIRNWSDVTKIIGQREELKLRNEQLQRELDALKNPKPPAGQPGGQPPNGQPSGTKSDDDDPKALRARLDELERAEKERTLQAKRKAITDVVLTRVPEAHKDAVRAMVRVLEEEPGAIDMKTDDTQAQGAKALDTLSRRHPSYFIAADGGTPVPTAAGAKVDFANMSWDQLPPDVQASMTDDEFAKHFGPSATRRRVSILGGGYQTPRK